MVLDGMPQRRILQKSRLEMNRACTEISEDSFFFFEVEEAEAARGFDKQFERHSGIKCYPKAADWGNNWGQ